MQKVWNNPTAKHLRHIMKHRSVGTYFLRQVMVAVLLLFSAASVTAATLVVSGFPDRSGAVPLSSAQLSGATYIFVSPATGISQVDFFLDSAPPATPRQIERKPPFDFSGTAPDDTAFAFSTQTVSDGQHTVHARVTHSNGTIEQLSAAFTVNNASPALQFSAPNISFTVPAGSTATQTRTVGLTATGADGAAYSVAENVSWLSVSPTSGNLPGSITVTLAPASLTAGSHSAVVTASGNGLVPASLTVDVVVSSAGVQLLFSDNPDRQAPSALQSASVSDSIYVFVPVQPGISLVNFYVDNPNKVGAPFQTERRAPYDMAGTAPNDQAFPFDTRSLDDGSHTVVAEVQASNGTIQNAAASFTVANNAPALVFSQGSYSASRDVDNPLVVQQTVDLTSNDQSGAPFQLSSSAAWLTASQNSSTTPASITLTADPAGLPVGSHTATLTASATGYTDAQLTFTMTITENVAGLVASPTSLLFSGSPNQTIATKPIAVTHSSGEQRSFTVSTDELWLSVDRANGSTPETINVGVDSSALAAGNYSGTVTLTSPGLPSINIPVTLGLASNDQCAPIPCSDVRISLPYQLSFTESQGHLTDSNGWGTGFTWIDKPSAGTGYIPANLEMSFFEGVLNVTTTAGIAFDAENSQDNALGVGFAAPNQITQISTQVVNIPSGSGNYEQAGLWFGNDEDNHMKLVVLSGPSGVILHYLLEVGGATVDKRNITVPNLVGNSITLSLIVNPFDRSVALRYKVDGGTNLQAAVLNPPDEFFSFDAAGIDPIIGTRSFAGIFATHRRGSSPLVYQFNDFTVEDGGDAPNPDVTIDFIRKSSNFSFPTSMVWGPDNRLYVTELFGLIHALTFDANMNVTATQEIDSMFNALGPRLTLGITVAPHSTAGNVELWVGHSSPSVDNGEPNSGQITRLRGPGFAEVTNIITGLPRAKANHSINSIHFGPDNRLYIAVGGNTGAGAPNNSNSEFGLMEEQPLSAAILVADVFAAGFDGTCANTSDIFGPPPCDVQTHATGLRNSYDFTFHSNGNMYATDNGLGVTGTYPPSPQPSCLGLGSTTSYLQGGHNPGSQPDLLLLIEEGRYYGHPNPRRDECVFKNGSYQGVAPLPNFQAPLYNLGDHKSSNAIVEYKGPNSCASNYLEGQLLITNFSVGDDVFRVSLNGTGTSVVEGTPLISGFNDPLPMTVSPSGVIIVGEFGGQRITTLQPVSLGCWETLQPSSFPVLDGTGAAINGLMYVVGGKNSAGHLATLLIYNPATNTWSQGANLPGGAVENPAVVALNGKLYVFGGSRQPFSDAVTNAAVFTPGSGWVSLPAMPTARGGATAQVLNGKIYVVGGMSNSGQSLATVEIFDPAGNNWQTGPSLATRRDNAGSAVLGNNLYVFGGRVRNADGTTVDGTLTSVEMLAPAASQWAGKAPMPTGRRAMAVGTLNGRAQVMGGELNSGASSGVFKQNQEYDPVQNTWRSLTDLPTPRHGAAAATINGAIYLFGGGTSSGASYTNKLEAMRF